MSERAPADVVRLLWERFEARDWEGAAELVADNLVVEWPHSGERFRGGGNFVEMNRSYPDVGWHIEVRRIGAEGENVVSEVAVPHREGVTYTASFFEVRDGLIRRITEYWVNGDSEAPPDWRRPYREG